MTKTALPGRGDGTQTWATPWHIVHAVEEELGARFALDACAQPHTAKADRFFALERGENGLASPWVDMTWCNPPYAEQDQWLARAAYFGGLGMRVVCLPMASTSSLYWRPTCFERGTVDFFEGRIAFLDATGAPVAGASFSSALVFFGPGFEPRRVRYRSAATGRLIAEARGVDLFGGAL